MPGCQALGATKFARHGSSRGVSAKILAQQAKKLRFSPVLGLQGELLRARTHARPSRAKNFAHRTHKHGDIETNDTTARPQDGAVETDDASAPEKCAKDAHFSLAKAMTVSIPHRYKRAKAIAVSDHRATWPTGPGCGVRGRWWGLAGQRADSPNHTSACQVPLVWRTPEGPAAVPVGGGGAWPGFETTRRAKLAARTARGRAAAHGHTKQPGPTEQHVWRPEHPWSHKCRPEDTAHNSTQRGARSASAPRAPRTHVRQLLTG